MYKMRFLALLIIFSFLLSDLGAQTEIVLYPDGVPGKIGNDSTDNPVLYYYAPEKDKATGASVVICPGGGYVMLAINYEGHKVAKWFQSHGVHAYVLRYRLGTFDGSAYQHPQMLNDVQRAMRIARARTKSNGGTPHLVGVMGFSAGGHLASSVSTHFDSGHPHASDPIERESCLPNFAILAYPVITMNDKYTHWGSRRFLLGPTPNDSLVVEMSNNLQVKSTTPPTFIYATSDDKSVPVQNSVKYYLALRDMGVPVEMHIFEHGPHGSGMAQNDPTLKQWRDLLEHWLTNWKVF